METGRVISFPKTDEQLLADAQAHYTAAERTLDRAAQLFRQDVLGDMLQLFEESAEKAQQTNRAGSFRKKLKAAGIKDETADAIIYAYWNYYTAQQLYNELAPRVGVPAITLQEMLERTHTAAGRRKKDPEQEPRKGGTVIHFTRYTED